MKQTDTFREHLQQTGVAPEQLALDIARLAYPGLVDEVYLARIDAVAATASMRCLGAGLGYARAEALLHALAHDWGFHGNRRDYYDPANSLLSDVLERRTGLPIMLSLVCIAVGRRIGLSMEGLGFPGHFMACYRDDSGTWLLDLFLGQVVATNVAEEHLAGVLGRPVHLSASQWQPVASQAMAARMLHNLRNAYLMQQNLPMAIRVIDFLMALAPQEATLWRERGLLNFKLENWEASLRDIQHYFFLSGLLPRVIPQGAATGGAAGGTAELPPEELRMMQIFGQAREMLNRIN